MTVNDITHPDYLDVSPRFIHQASSGEVTRAEFEKQYYHKDGHIIWGQVASSLVRDVKETPLYFISHVKDIDQKALYKITVNVTCSIDSSSNLQKLHLVEVIFFILNNRFSS